MSPLRTATVGALCLQVVSMVGDAWMGQLTPLQGCDGMRLGGFLPRTALATLALPTWHCSLPSWKLPRTLIQRRSECRLSTAELCANAPHASGLITALIGISVRNLSLQLFAVPGEEEKALQGINFNYKDDMLCGLAGRQAWPSCSRCAVPAMSTAAPDSYTAAWASFWLHHSLDFVKDLKGHPFQENRFCEDQGGRRCTYRCSLLTAVPFPACLALGFSSSPGGFS